MVKITWLERKSPEWIKATIVNEAGGTFTDVSINKVGKKGEVFPNFDGLMPGQEVDGVLWQSPKGQWYLFPPKPKTTQGEARGGRGVGMQKVMEQKAGFIKEAQSNKEEGIKLSSTIRMAVDCALAELNGLPNVNTSHIQERIQYWRKWLWQEWERPIKGDTLTYVPDNDPLAQNEDLTNVPPDEWNGM